jgi:hypothetical protein
VDRRWLERIAPRVYRRPSQLTKASLRWDVVVLSLQQVMHKPLHVGGRRAVELSGYAHYVGAGETPQVYLYGLGLPSWLAELPLCRVPSMRFRLSTDGIVYKGNVQKLSQFRFCLALRLRKVVGLWLFCIRPSFGNFELCYVYCTCCIYPIFWHQ